MSLSELKSRLTDRQKIEEWLESIGCPKDEANEVLENCAKNKDARAYFVNRFEQDCAA